MKNQLFDGFRSMWSEPQRDYMSVCSGHGVLFSQRECFCDIGYDGVNCEIALTGKYIISLISQPSFIRLLLLLFRRRRFTENDSPKVKPNSILFVVDSFGELLDSQSANTVKATAEDLAHLQNAVSYKLLATQLAAEPDVDVTVMYSGPLADAAQRKLFNEAVKEMTGKKVQLIR